MENQHKPIELRKNIKAAYPQFMRVLNERSVKFAQMLEFCQRLFIDFCRTFQQITTLKSNRLGSVIFYNSLEIIAFKNRAQTTVL